MLGDLGIPASLLVIPNHHPKAPIAGDADFAAVEPIVGAITPVPGGVGTVTTSVLMAHVVEAAKRAAARA